MEPARAAVPGGSRSGKRAVLCGVSYRQKKHRLKGTTNDVINMKRLLVERFQFPEDNIRVLTENEKNEERKPTRKNLEKSLHWLVKDCKPKDSLVFYFSGHGLRQFDFDQDEIDGLDETLCPSDFLTEGMIVDNYINDTLVRPLGKDVKLHAIIDACHSGTVLDLTNVYHTDEEEWSDNSPPSGANKGTNGGLAICISACRDDQKAADTNAFSKKTVGGAMTQAFIRAIEENSPRLTYGKLLTSMRGTIQRANEGRCFHLRKASHRLLLQEPQLSSSERFNVYDKEFTL